MRKSITEHVKKLPTKQRVKKEAEPVEQEPEEETAEEPMPDKPPKLKRSRAVKKQTKE